MCKATISDAPLSSAPTHVVNFISTNVRHLPWPFRSNVRAVSVSQADTNPADADVPITTTPDVRLPAQAKKNTKTRKAG